MRGALEKIEDYMERICVYCKRIECGDGVWFTAAGQSNPTWQECLCPECCRKRFPQFYSDYEQPAKTVVGGLLARFTRIFRPG